MRIRSETILIAAVLPTALAAPCWADLVTLGAAKDNTLFEDPGGNLSSGRGESLFAGKTSVEELRRALIAFDLAPIPAGSTITAVTLTLQCTRSASLARPVTLHPLASDWGEGASISLGEGGMGAPAEPGDATWTSRFHPSVSWSTPGGDFGPMHAVTQVAGNGSCTWSSASMVVDIQNWLDSPATNYGWAIVGDEEFAQTAKRFASRENADPLLRPALTVEYTPIPAPPIALAPLTLMVFGRRSRCNSVRARKVLHGR